MGKTVALYYCYSKQTKTKSLSTARTQKEDSKENTLLQDQRKQNQKIKTTGLPPVKRFLDSHIARIHTLFIHHGHVS
jgi:hypothetical protein